MSSVDLSLITSIYDDFEQAILFDYFEIPRPEPIQNLDVLEEYEPESGGIRVRRDADGNLTGHSLGNAVARIALVGIQRRLPQWGCVLDGEVSLSRKYDTARHQIVQSLPVFLFSINWADSGPGYSWPEAYHRAYLPGFDRHIVTASQDSPDVHGYTDETIGHFKLFRPSSGLVRDGVHNLLSSWWRDQLDGWGQERWADLLDCGEINPSTATEWADLIWSDAESAA